MTTVKAQEKFVTVNGAQLRYLDWGTAGKTPLVCLHGHTGQAHIWDEFAEAMAPHYHELAWASGGTAAANGPTPDTSGTGSWRTWRALWTL